MNFTYTNPENYERILQLGMDMAKQLPLYRPSDMLDFPAMTQAWTQLDNLLAARYAYDAIAGLVKSQDLQVLCMNVRRRVHYLTAELLRYERPGEMLEARGVVVAKADQLVLIEKGRHYGTSWKKRGGTGAFMMLARKWDRMETILSNLVGSGGPPLLARLRENPGNVQDDVDDLRRYLLLVESEAQEQWLALDAAESGAGYVNQGQDRTYPKGCKTGSCDVHCGSEECK